MNSPQLSSLLPLVLCACVAREVPAPVVDAFRYQPPAFAGDDRQAAILLAAPQIDDIFRAGATENHHVGHVWGVVTEDGLVHSGKFGVCNRNTEPPVDEHTRFHIASLTKSLTCLAILKLRDDGRLSLQDPVRRHVPEFDASRPLTMDARPITIEHLMTMTSGLPEDNPWADRQLDDTQEELLDLLAGGLSFSTVSGSAYEYSNLGYAVLGLVIARASGRSYQDFVTETILEPLGMLETVWDYGDVPADALAMGYRWEDGRHVPEPMLHTGAFASIGGLLTTLHDFSRYVAFHLDAWPARDAGEEGPVRRSTVREMHRAARTRLQPAAVDFDGALCPTMTGYAYGLGVRTDCRNRVRVSHTGGLPGFGTNVQFYPQYGIGLISFANLTYARSSDLMDGATAAIFADGRPTLRDLPVSRRLTDRAAEVAEFVQSWDVELGDEILADNVYLDRSRERRQREAQELLEAIGPIRSVGAVEPQNQLRGTFVLQGERGDARVFFTLSPESPPRVQRIDLSRVPER